VAILAHAPISVATLKAFLGGGAGSAQDTQLEMAIDATTDILEFLLNGRRLVSRLTGTDPEQITEFHAPACGRTEILLGDYPVISAVTVHESPQTPRAYDATTLLVAGTDYELVAGTGMLRRLSNGVAVPWATGPRAIKVGYTAGYQNHAGSPSAAQALPAALRQVACFVAAAIWKESSRQAFGVSSVSDAAGTVTRFMGYLPPSVKAIVRGHARPRLGKTWERAA
jgi:hypothetical protein